MSVKPEEADADVLDAVAARLARYKLPKAFVRVDEVVRSPSGKADYAWARAAATGAPLSAERGT